MPRAAENVAKLTAYVDQQQRLVVVLAVARGVARAFAVVPENRGPVTLERTQREAVACATAWALERGAASVEWQTPKGLPLPNGRDIGAAMEMVRGDIGRLNRHHAHG
jgi:hypothetical protein